MNATARPAWIRTAVIVGVAYASVGIVFALPASHAQFWRLAAWVVSGAVYVVHVWHERVRLRCSSISAALHVASGAAVGAFGLAIGALVHSVSTNSPEQHRRLLLIALAAWPVITAVPAFLIGLVASELLGRLSRHASVG